TRSDSRDSSRFVFSSRRRHTRWPRDWSSDVCSSDLDTPTFYICPGCGQPVAPGEDYVIAQEYKLGSGFALHLDRADLVASVQRRSEERRVGKECRVEWWK